MVFLRLRSNIIRTIAGKAFLLFHSLSLRIHHSLRGKFPKFFSQLDASPKINRRDIEFEKVAGLWAEVTFLTRKREPLQLPKSLNLNMVRTRGLEPPQGCPY